MPHAARVPLTPVLDLTRQADGSYRRVPTAVIDRGPHGGQYWVGVDPAYGPDETVVFERHTPYAVGVPVTRDDDRRVDELVRKAAKHKADELNAEIDEMIAGVFERGFGDPRER